MSCKVQQSVCSDCVTYVKSRIKFNTFNTFNNVAYFHQDSWTFEDQQIRDESLRQYSKRHNVRLLVIKYDEIKKIPKILSDALIRNASARKLA